ncbi:uncharacterized protein LOC110847258 isoform X2 [Folsomia candida]|uniref:Uncharacterized protein n=1 Tax=Folsomia candida TaxID=158441 RepID=A0A226EM80_FOLCA|nr:uncharacterized protein LOC110847258 isoform X2 [Folsomia candida]OXA58400.1 hypothetical protein Fcan01_06875 [Folsomia candida]
MKLIINLFALVIIASGLDEDAVKELKCSAVSSPDSGIDLKWFGSINQFYVPLWNQLYATRTAADLLSQDARHIPFEAVQPASCLTMNKDSTISGFGRQVKYNITGDETSITFRAPWSGAKTGKFSFHMMDNKSYVLGATCWDDNEASWAVLSTVQNLEPKSRTDILKYIKSLGFDENKAVDENYAYCGLNQLLLTPISYNSQQQHLLLSPYYIYFK